MVFQLAKRNAGWVVAGDVEQPSKATVLTSPSHRNKRTSTSASRGIARWSVDKSQSADLQPLQIVTETIVEWPAQAADPAGVSASQKDHGWEM